MFGKKKSKNWKKLLENFPYGGMLTVEEEVFGNAPMSRFTF